MAGYEADEFNALAKLLRATSEEATAAAEDAAAQEYLKAAQAAAPRKTGQLKSSIKIIEGKDRKALSYGTNAGVGPRRRLFVGPEKKKGYYGFFLEKGWKAPKGSTMVAGKKSRRLKRDGRGLAHSQSGVMQYRQVPADPWFEPAIKAADPQAVRAAEAAFNAKLEEINNRG